jgi:hypothetical protein
MNILTHPVHTGYQFDLAKTGHEFYSLEIAGTNEVFWDTKSRPQPKNFHHLKNLQDAPVKFDLALVHFDLGYEHLRTLDLPLVFKEHCLRQPFYVPKNWQDRISYYCFASQAAAARWIVPTESAWRKVIIGMGLDTDVYKDHHGKAGDILVVAQHIRSRGNEKGRDNLLELSRHLSITVVGRGSEGLPGAQGPANNYDELLQHYRSHKIFLNPSNTLGLSTLEAMATGMAVVTFRTINSDVIQHGVNGLVVDTVDEAVIALQQLLKNEPLLKSLGTNARQTIQQRFRQDLFVQRWNTLFRNAVCEYHCDAEPLSWKPFDITTKPAPERAIAERLIAETFEYNRVGHDTRKMTFLANGRIGRGAAGCEVFWDIKIENAKPILEISSGASLTCRLGQQPDNSWTGHWLIFERMPIVLRPALSPKGAI